LVVLRVVSLFRLSCADSFTVERTRAFGELVRNAPALIPLLPWSAEFEKDKFLSPDFTSLEVLTFCGKSKPTPKRNVG